MTRTGVLGAEDSEFEKCGDVIVAPKHKVFALTCSLCHDIFMKLDEFSAHILKEHDVYLGLNECDEEEEDPIAKTSKEKEVDTSTIVEAYKDIKAIEGNEGKTVSDKGIIDNDEVMKNSESNIVNGNLGREKAEKSCVSVEKEISSHESSLKDNEDEGRTSDDEKNDESVIAKAKDNEIQPPKNSNEMASHPQPTVSHRTESAVETVEQNKSEGFSNQVPEENAMEVDEILENNETTNTENDKQENDFKPTDPKCVESAVVIIKENEEHKYKEYINANSKETIETAEFNKDLERNLDVAANNTVSHYEDTTDLENVEVLKSKEAKDQMEIPTATIIEVNEIQEDISKTNNDSKPSDSATEHLEADTGIVNQKTNNDGNTPLSSNPEILPEEDFAYDISNPETDEEDVNKTNEDRSGALNFTSTKKKIALEELEESKLLNSKSSCAEELTSMTDNDRSLKENDEIIKDVIEGVVLQENKSTQVQKSHDAKKQSPMIDNSNSQKNSSATTEEDLNSPQEQNMNMDVDHVVSNNRTNVVFENTTDVQGKSNGAVKKADLDDKKSVKLRDEAVQTKEAEKIVKNNTENVELLTTLGIDDNENLKNYQDGEKNVNHYDGKELILKSPKIDQENKMIKTNESKEDTVNGNSETNKLECKDRRKSIKLAEIFEDLDLELDEEDEDMKVLENLMLREDSSYSCDDEEIGNRKDDDSQEKEMPNINIDENAQNDNDTIECMGRMKKAKQKQHYDTKIESTKYTDDILLEMEGDSKININPDTPHEVEQIEAFKNTNDKTSKNNFPNSNSPKKKRDKSQSPCTPKMPKSEKKIGRISPTKSKNLTSQKTVPKSIKKQDSIKVFVRNESFQTGMQFKSQISKLESIDPSPNITSKTLHEENNGLLTPKTKILPIIDTPRPTQLVDRSIFSKKRKLIEETMDTKILPLAEINAPNARKQPRLDLQGPITNQSNGERSKQQKTTTFNDSPKLQNTTANSKDDSIFESERQFTLPKGLIIKKISSKTENKEPSPSSSVSEPSSSSSSPSSSTSQTPLFDWQNNPVVRIKRVKHQKFDTVSKSETHSVQSLSTLSPSLKTTTNPNNRYPRENPDDVNDVLADIYNQVKEEVISKEIPEDTKKIGITTDTNTAIFNDENTAVLLKKIGLNIISDANFESTAPASKVRCCRNLVEKFANALYESELFQKPVSKDNVIANEKFKILLNVVNEFLPNSSKLSLVELKRIVNLISLWIVDLYPNLQVVMAEVQGAYIKNFNFIVCKLPRRSFYCEFCTLWLNNQEKYKSHRLVHLDPSNALICEHCFKVYKMFGPFEAHMEKCKSKLQQP